MKASIGLDRQDRVRTVPGFSQNRYGTLGEEAIVPVDALGEYPANLTPVQAAAIWMQYLTAYGALVHYGGVKAGRFRLDSSCVLKRGPGGHPDRARCTARRRLR